ncbi:lipopolysaccharide biosynthesis protein [Streptomyces sp. TRM66268-LWL]|uniref:Lipopolysaccharide biosynthesis protein n=1 Tax=Streptomyces polyasparticus TaxID=2767826 RepID=A0ABR7SG93_9ACTN|nr:lipopolysaccharide biosynthesis protein [Streptomyces polyasparticus]MBC9714423.1 lipopolysaccharide biosynthesis protein [Streptomyces polyasparticus]
MSRRVARGFAWSTGGSAVSVAVLLCYTAVTARLVAPDSFGRYALACTLGSLFGYVAAAGLPTCLLRADRLTRPLVRSALTVGAVTGAGSTAAVQVAALGLGRWADAETVRLVQLLGVQLLLAPLSGTALAVLRRAGQARQAALLETGGQVAGCAAALGLLLAGWTPWGLAAAAPAASLLVLAWTAAGGTLHRLPGGPAVPVRELLGQSGFFAGYGMVQSATNNAPLWCASALFGPAATGWYSRASLATGIPLTALAQGLQRAASPELAEARARDGGTLPARAAQDLLCVTSGVGFLGFGAVAATGPDWLLILLGPGWETAAALLPALALGAACALLCSTGNSLDQIRRAPRASLVTQAAVIAGTAAAIALAALTGSLTVLALATTAPALGHSLQLRRWSRHSVLPAAPLLRAHLMHAALGLGLFAAGRTATLLAPGGSFTQALLSTAAVLTAAVACRPWWRRVPAVRTALGRGAAPSALPSQELVCASPSPAR